MRPRGFAAPPAPVVGDPVAEGPRRFGIFAAALLTLTTGCAVRARPYRFASPMLGSASVPAAPLPGAREASPPDRARDPSRPGARDRAGAQPAQRVAAGIRVTAPSSASGPRTCAGASAPRQPACVASAEAALAVAAVPAAREPARAALPAPHASPKTAPLPTVRSPDDLRTLVGRRDPRDPIAAALGWARDLGAPLEAQTSGDLVAWADRAGRLADPTAEAHPGDLLVFDRVTSDAEADLVAVVVARDARGVTELAYVGGGVIRRGFVDANRPALRRDHDGHTVNTFMRHGKRWPTKGSHYLAGELLAHIVHVR